MGQAIDAVTGTRLWLLTVVAQECVVDTHHLRTGNRPLEEFQSEGLGFSPSAVSCAAVAFHLGCAVMPRNGSLQRILTTIAILIMVCASFAIGIELGRLIGSIWR